MTYTTIEFKSWDEWYSYTIPCEGAYHFIVKEYGKVELECWYLNGMLHREDDKPAEIWYYKNGKVEIERWYQNGNKHREGGLPAEIWYDENGKVEREYWYTSSYTVTLYSDGEISVGCQRHTLPYWLENWEAIAKEHDISDSEIQEYKRVFNYIQSR